ncbi:hypothetical protein P7H06_15710 [Paenibacillus larvae]|nr:hypothetical protein [Paenibacillus larvae]MDT2260666.1 hypothetical protein [Paenibacillus larvae]
MGQTNTGNGGAKRTSAWDMAHENTYEYSAWDVCGAEDFRNVFYNDCHATAVGAPQPDADHGEIVIEDAVVIANILITEGPGSP